jgi:hypothetical protein
LLLTAYLGAEKPLSKELNLLQSRYLSFVMNAYNEDCGRFRNFMSYQRGWLEEMGSEDSHGRTLWSLGAMVSRCTDKAHREMAKNLFERALPAVGSMTSPRTWAYAVVAADEFLRAHPNNVWVTDFMSEMAMRLKQNYDYFRKPDWHWFEDSVTYGNARLPQALMLAGKRLGNEDMTAAGLESLEWLMKLQTVGKGIFAPIGSNGFYIRGKDRALFDQQPIEAAGAVSACLCAHRMTGDNQWLSEADRAFRWFLGENMVGEPLYDHNTGSCRDGLHADRANENRGAESTLSFLTALVEMERAATAATLPSLKVHIL